MAFPVLVRSTTHQRTAIDTAATTITMIFVPGMSNVRIDLFLESQSGSCGYEWLLGPRSPSTAF